MLIAASSAGALLASASNAQADVVETRELEETVPAARGAPLLVIVKNITGSVRVTEHDRDRVEMRATETIRGDLQADVERARAELQLRTETEQGRVAFRVRHVNSNGDVACDCDRGGWWGRDYVVEYDIEVRVPRGAAVELATVNDGDVEAEGITGNFSVSNVNGGVRLTGLTGSGEITTVNGDVEAAFARAPADPTSFHTVNGDLDVTFPDDLAANLQFQTLHGEVFTDFELASVTQTPVVDRGRDRGRFVMRSGRSSTYRVGAGGDTLSFHTLNGEIYVRKASR
jgi:hypothetical protein